MTARIVQLGDSAIIRHQYVSQCRTIVEGVPPQSSLGSLQAVTEAAWAACAGGLVLKAALQALLPNFLALLAADYQRWALGETDRKEQAAGELMKRPAAAQPLHATRVPVDWVRQSGNRSLHLSM